MNKKGKGFIGVDFDGTLLIYHKFQGPEVTGEPVIPMVNRVKKWLSEGKNVKIFTARVADEHSEEEKKIAEKVVKEWCLKHIGVELDVTANKSIHMYEFWDDKAIGVEKNTGKIRYAR